MNEQATNITNSSLCQHGAKNDAHRLWLSTDRGWEQLLQCTELQMQKISTCTCISQRGCAANQAGARLALANDPDADRLAVSERVDLSEEVGDGGGVPHWQIFSGNDIGILLADWLWTHRYQVEVPLAGKTLTFLPGLLLHFLCANLSITRATKCCAQSQLTIMLHEYDFGLAL
jgi:hypothetical protein